MGAWPHLMSMLGLAHSFPRACLSLSEQKLMGLPAFLWGGVCTLSDPPHHRGADSCAPSPERLILEVWPKA